ncbi:hypothetical protein IOLA_233 [uncultured bacterium]|nr:hypothetical protein IOLA_233 [uncultured bacterium]
MQSINLVRYINTSLLQSLNKKYLNRDNSNQIKYISSNSNLLKCDFNIKNNFFEQNFYVSNNLSDIKIVKNVILSNQTESGLLISIPCFFIHMISNISYLIFNNIKIISNLVKKIEVKIQNKSNNKFIIRNKIFNFIKIVAFIILFNFIFALVYLMQILYIIIFLFLNFMISIFYIL